MITILYTAILTKYKIQPIFVTIEISVINLSQKYILRIFEQIKNVRQQRRW